MHELMTSTICMCFYFTFYMHQYLVHTHICHKPHVKLTIRLECDWNVCMFEQSFLPSLLHINHGRMSQLFDTKLPVLDVWNYNYEYNIGHETCMLISTYFSPLSVLPCKYIYQLLYRQQTKGKRITKENPSGLIFCFVNFSLFLTWWDPLGSFLSPSTEML